MSCSFLTLADTPAYSYFKSMWNTPLDWGYNTDKQDNVNNREIYWPRGKVLGGMYIQIYPSK